MRMVLDNNILVSSLISAVGHPAQLANAWRDGRFELVTSGQQLTRLADVLSRPRIRELVSEPLVESLLSEIVAVATIVEPRQDVTACSDFVDNLILGIAIAAKAHVLVTGDKRHLLPLRNWEGIEIRTCAEALSLLNSPPERG